tara:strand:+ start:502 stop:927 length:426 start_codon:yes stop_codon:yes gene_type:complete
MWIQKEINLKPRARGFHIITESVLVNIPELEKIKVGILQLFVKHTSAALTINENTDQTVRQDFEAHFNILVPENKNYYKHIFEGSDDIPAHLKSSILGSSISIPITDGKLNLGTWQGIYLCEHRNQGTGRRIIATIGGQAQ